MTKRALKILHLISGLEIGGTEAMLEKLVSRLDAARFQNRVVVLQGLGPIGERMKSAGFDVAPLGLGRGRISFGALKALHRLTGDFSPDIVQSWLYHADLLGLVEGKFLRGKKVAWNLRCTDLESASLSAATAIVRKLCAWLSFAPDVVVSNSEAGLRFHRSLGYRPRRAVVIPNGFDVARFKPDAAARQFMRAMFGFDAKTPVVGQIARFDAQKDYASFIAAARLALVSRPDLRFVLCGKGVSFDNPDFVSLLDGVPLEKFRLLGAREDVPEILNALDIFSLSSAYGEGFPNVLGEAMACGVPCVATDVGDVGLILGDEQFLVPARDPQAMAAAWNKILELSDEELALLKEKIRRRVEDEYSLGAVTRSYEVLYQELAGAPCAG